MVDTTDTVENFNETIDELLFANANMKVLFAFICPSSKTVTMSSFLFQRLSESYDGHPKLICEECFSELLMVAKFREKCAMAEKRLQWLIKTTKSRKPIQMVANELKAPPPLKRRPMAFVSTQNVNTIEENIELVECSADTIENHPEYMIIENDETTAESDDATELFDDGRIETLNVVQESAEVSVSFLSAFSGLRNLTISIH